ncbi:MAG: amidohydrolase [Candidatus Thermoplasmatota archaeon]|nr:amidohydrolase [Candidatus Thermoplasmatota archaeon]
MELSVEEEKQIVSRIKNLPESVLRAKEDVLEMSHFIHSNPELGSEEFKCSAKLIGSLKKWGFDVEENYLGMKTAFLAKVGKGDPKVAVFAEYDALPIGQACGHNILGSWAFGVGASLADEIKKLKSGTFYVVGSPAEEGRGEYASSKVVIAPELKKIGVHAVFTSHPVDEWEVGNYSLGIKRYSFVFHGKDAHAAVSPEKGINALDAAVDFYMNFRMMFGLLSRKHQIVLSAIIKDGGSAPNVIPGRAELWVDMRSEDDEFLQSIFKRTIEMAKNIAAVHLCTFESSPLAPEMKPRKRNELLDSIYYQNAVKYVGNIVVSPKEFYERPPRASSDVGNVSQLIPTSHLGIKVGPVGMAGHSEHLRDSAITPQAHEALLTGIAIAHDSILQYFREKN